MIVNDKSIVKEKDGLHYYFTYVKVGFEKLIKYPVIIVALVLLLAVEVGYTVHLITWIQGSIDLLEKFERQLWSIAAIEVMAVIDTMSMFVIGRPRAANGSEIKFIRSGFMIDNWIFFF